MIMIYNIYLKDFIELINQETEAQGVLVLGLL